MTTPVLNKFHLKLKPRVTTPFAPNAIESDAPTSSETLPIPESAVPTSIPESVIPTSIPESVIPTSILESAPIPIKTKLVLIDANLPFAKKYLNIESDANVLAFGSKLTKHDVMSPSELTIIFSAESRGLSLFGDRLKTTFYTQSTAEYLKSLQCPIKFLLVSPKSLPAIALSELNLPTLGAIQIETFDISSLSKMKPAKKISPRGLLSPKTVDISTDIRNHVHVVSGLKYRTSKKTFYLTKDVTWNFTLADDYYLTLNDDETFDGQGFTISYGLDGLGATYGLFEINATSLETAPIIKDLTVKSQVFGSENGGLVRSDNTYFKIYNCTYIGDLPEYAGGLCGYYCSEFVIKNCHHQGTIGDYGGGIVGEECFNGTISECSSTGEIGAYSGGIVGYDSYNLTIKKCESCGPIGLYGGGITGYDCYDLTIKDCVSHGNIGSFGGGIAGNYNYASSGETFVISHCHSHGVIGNEAGGIIGNDSGTYFGLMTILECSSKGDIGYEGGGIIGRSIFATGSDAVLTVRHCRSSGMIGYRAGGIIGHDTDINNNAVAIIAHCHSSGDIGDSGGGILGASANTNQNSRITIEKCASSGQIGRESGGIIGSNCYSDDNSTLEILKCHSSGVIGESGGGIIGYNCYSDDIETAPFIAVECYSTGRISQYAGGIAGDSSGSLTINNCYSNGDIGQFAGGLVGSNSYGTMTVSGCYSTGAISQFAGGICGYYTQCSDDDVIIIEKCLSLGKLISIGGGGICGSNCGSNEDKDNFVIRNCYSVGQISYFAGGVVGEEGFDMTITKCYATGHLLDGAGGIVGNNFDTPANISDCYNRAPVGIGEANLSLIRHDQLDTLDNTIWKATDKYPILRVFRADPWKKSDYRKYRDQPAF
jgi:hypothetical protein